MSFFSTASFTLQFPSSCAALFADVDIAALGQKRALLCKSFAKLLQYLRMCKDESLLKGKGGLGIDVTFSCSPIGIETCVSAPYLAVFGAVLFHN